MLVVIENTYLEQMAENEFTSFCISETNPFFLFLIKKNLGNGLHLHSRGQVIIIRRKNYLTSQSWLLLMGGSSNFYCAMGAQ